jgi:HPr kinase/phosphorylase
MLSVTLEKIAKNLKLDIAFTPSDLSDIFITTSDVNRPGLLLAGFSDFFDPTRIQILGNAELGYLNGLSREESRKRLHALFSHRPPTVVFTRGAVPFEDVLALGKEFGVPVLTTTEPTSAFMNDVISLLSVDLAPRVTRHGVLVEVYGEGILILGESGVGKSETAIELIKRGHRLVADDAVELCRVSNRTIFGQAPANIRHFIELRGVGIINVARMFGAGAVKPTEKVDLVAELVRWDERGNYSKTGLEDNTIDILGLRIPLTVIPVQPGRNLAVIIEVAAINNRQKAMGYNGAQELMAQLGLTNDITEGVHTVL